MKILEEIEQIEYIQNIVNIDSKKLNIFEQRELLLRQPLLNEIVASVPLPVCILNDNRQIVYWNQSFNQLTNYVNEGLVGQKPGNAFNCINVDNNNYECGKTEFCKYCGAHNSIQTSLKNVRGVEECRITTANNDAMELLVWATPLVIEDQFFTLFTLSDISDEKRKKALENIFFHDILNTLGALRGVADLLKGSQNEDQDSLIEMVSEMSNKLIDEIQAQRALNQAENHSLVINLQPFSSKEILEELKMLYENHEAADQKYIEIDIKCADNILISDKTILRRVLGNLVKNALEASKQNETIKLSCERQGDFIKFYVKNPGLIPKDVQQQMFQRSFSTKGINRGLGTYSVKLLTERYLKGKIQFSSTETDGTCFSATYPLIYNE